eukprot:312802-Chlamydomonas_euryale.AAC.5
MDLLQTPHMTPHFQTFRAGCPRRRYPQDGAGVPVSECGVDPRSGRHPHGRRGGSRRAEQPEAQ